MVEIKLSNAAQNFFTNWETVKHGVLTGSILWPLHFTVYVNHDFKNKYLIRTN
jgi:hypothetical protein